ncbi:MAG: hypothetical protein JWN50_757 [Parcubacteria group bacterium]|nr:hypothetical protein [Parcubacteria group bacterium]
MQQRQGVSSTSSSTVPRMTAEQIDSQNSGSPAARLECHLLFFHELNHGKGNGQVPRLEADRKRYFAEVRRLLSKEYHLDMYDLARLVALYNEKNNGPSKVRRELLDRTTPQPAVMLS